MMNQSNPLDAALSSIKADDLARHIQPLASDEFEGRLPGTKGEDLAVNYIADQLKRLGLKPGNTDGTYFQKVPLVGITADPNMQLSFAAGAKKLSLRFGDEFVGWTKRVVAQTGIQDSDVVFAGYGVVAPEFNWDDYKGVDVRDKTIIMLINDPPVPDPNDPSKLDEKVFGGKAMTYYGRWTYKFEIAAQKGAKGCLLVHETGPAGYPWGVVQGSWTGEQFDLVAPDKNMSRCATEGWLSYDSAKKLFPLGGQDLDALKKAAVSRNFKPVPLGVKASLSIKNTLRTVDSRNVIAKLNGSDPKLTDQYVIYMAHWDHLGKDPSLKGDQIFNGAVDNASGTAGLLELANAFTKLETPPRRSLIFLAVTAEEQGLLGSKYYSLNPIYPLTKTAAAINMDGLNVLGKTKDITIVGKGNSTLDDVTEAMAKEQGRVVRPDPEPEKGFFYRSDHFNFVKQGVPALYIDPGVDYIGRPEDWGLQMREKYNKENYHKPSDEFDPSWNLSGAVQDLQLLLQVGYRVANEDKYPEWKPGTEFKAKREQMLQ
jgi:Zn-dependent M28 family amino/carboxypeptidase